MLLGRAWYDQDKKPINDRAGGESYYRYVQIDDLQPAEWTYYSQLIVPDRTPENPSYEADEVPVNAAYAVVWAIVFEFSEKAYFDDLDWRSYDLRPRARQQLREAVAAFDWQSQCDEDLRLVAAHPILQPYADRAGQLHAAFAAADRVAREEHDRPGPYLDALTDFTRLCREWEELHWALRTLLLLED
jgi:hypothetical protein